MPGHRLCRTPYAGGYLFFFVRSCHGGTGFSGRLMPTGTCSFLPAPAAEAPASPAASCRRGISFFARPKKETKKSPGMRFPVLDSRRNGKSHIPGPAACTRTSISSKKPGVLLNRYGYFSFGSGARERPHRAARELRASRGEASGPPADAETYILTVQLFIRVAGSPEPPPAQGCNTREARSCPRWLRALTCKLKGQLKPNLRIGGRVFTATLSNSEDRNRAVSVRQPFATPVQKP